MPSSHASHCYPDPYCWEAEPQERSIKNELFTCYGHCNQCHAFTLWLTLLFLLVLATATESFAQNVGDLSPHPYSSNGVGNPFNLGGPYSLSRPALPGQGPVSPTSPYTWSNVAPKSTGPAVFDRAEFFRFAAPPPPPTVITPRKGPYGISLPGNHPLAIEAQ